MASSIPDIEHYPLAPPPPGVIPNFQHPESRASDIYITAGICIPLILLFALLRLYAKLKVTKLFKWDDLTCALGIAASLTYIIMTVVLISGGPFGYHAWEVVIGDFTKPKLELSLALEAIYGPIIWLIKLSLFVLILGIFSSLRWLKYLAIIGATLTGLCFVSTSIALAVVCAPTSGTSQFDYFAAYASPKCEAQWPLILVQAAFNLASDIYLILLPLPAVWSLNLPFKKKLALSAVFGTGLVACIASILGLVYRIKLLRNVHDDTWTAIPSFLSTFIEVTAATMVVCMPATAAVFREWKTPVLSFMSTYKRRLWSTGGSGSTQHQKMTSETDLKPLSRPSTTDRERYLDRHARSLEEPFSLNNWEPETHGQPIFVGGPGAIRKTTEFNVASAPTRHGHLGLEA